jgi:carbamoyltransferase
MRSQHWSAILDQPTHRMIMRYHPEVGHLYVPGLVARMPHERGGYVIRTNEDGFRSNIPFEPRRDGTPRILALGDSFTDGQGCDNHERFTDLLADMLGASAYNYGVSGSAPDQQLLIYERLARHVEADLIVWAIAIHNIERLKHTHRPSTDRMTGRPILVPKPYFTLDAGTLALHHVPVPRVRPVLDEKQESRFLDEPRASVLAGHQAIARIYGTVRDTVARAFPDLPDQMRSAVYRAAGIQMHEDYAHGATAGWQLMAALVRRLAESAEGIPVLIVPIPTYHYCVDRIRPIYDPLFESLANPAIGLYALPITDCLVSRRSLAQRRDLFEQQGHLSPAGHAAVAQLIAAEAERLGLVHRTTSARLRPVEKTPARSVLGVSFCARGGAAALVRDGEVVAAAVEDLFTRQSGQGGFPNLAVNYCLEAAGIHQQGLAGVARARDTAALVGAQVTWARSQGHAEAWRTLVDSWKRDELVTTTAAAEHVHYDGPAFEVPHGTAQCMSAFADAAFDRAAILSLHAGVDGTVATIAIGAAGAMRVLKELPGRHGLTDLGRHVAKRLGLPGRQPFRELAEHLTDRDVRDEAAIPAGAIQIAPDGAFVVESLEGWCAASVVAAAATIVKRLLLAIQKDTSEAHVCLVGEVFQDPAIAEAAARAFPSGTISVHSVGGHATAAIGAALLGWEQVSGVPARPATGLAKARGPAFSSEEIRAFLETYAFPYRNGSENVELRNDLAAKGARISVFEQQLSLTGQTTSVSADGRPAPLTPFDAYCHLMEDGVDALVMGDFVVLKCEQPAWTPRRRPASPDPAPSENENRRRRLRWVQGWMPSGSPAPIVEETAAWISPNADVGATCVALNEEDADDVPPRLLSRVPAGKWRTAIRRLLAETLAARA